MVNSLGYPLESLAVEKGLDQMPHVQLTGQEVPCRRADIICFAKEIHPDYSLYPLLLIECKSVKLNNKMKGQVIGYNRFLQSYFLAIVNQTEMMTGWYDRTKCEYQFVDGLPSYPQLLSSIKH